MGAVGVRSFVRRASTGLVQNAFSGRNESPRRRPTALLAYKLTDRYARFAWSLTRRRWRGSKGKDVEVILVFPALNIIWKLTSVIHLHSTAWPCWLEKHFMKHMCLRQQLNNLNEMILGLHPVAFLATKTGGDMLPSPYDPLAYLSHTRSLGPPQTITAPAINISALNKVRRFNCVITTMKIYRHKNSVQRFIGGAKPPKYGMP